jgi:hypothetical protein
MPLYCGDELATYTSVKFKLAVASSIELPTRKTAASSSRWAAS